MYKITVTYDSLFDDEKITQDVYFHASKARVLEYALKFGGRDKLIAYLFGDYYSDNKNLDAVKAVGIVQRLMEFGYGRREGQRFIQTPEEFEEFKSTQAYDEVIVTLLENGDEFARFGTSLFPNSVGDVSAKHKSTFDRVSSGEITMEQAVDIINQSENSNVENTRGELETKSSHADSVSANAAKQLADRIVSGEVVVDSEESPEEKKARLLKELEGLN